MVTQTTPLDDPRERPLSIPHTHTHTVSRIYLEVLALRHTTAAPAEEISHHVHPFERDDALVHFKHSLCEDGEDSSSNSAEENIE